MLILLLLIFLMLVLSPIFGNSLTFIHIIGVWLIILGSYPLVRIIMGKGEPFEIINFFCAWFVLSIGVRGLLILQSGSQWLSLYDINSEHYKTTILLVFLYGIIALVALYLGYWSKLGVAIANKIPKLFFFPTSRLNIITISTFALLVGAISTHLFLIKIGGIEVMKNSARVIEEGIREGGRLYYSLFLDFTVIGFLFLYICTLGKRKKIIEKVLFLSFIGLIICNFLILPFKGYIVGFFVFLLVINHYLKKQFTLKKLMLIISILVLILPLLNNYRNFGIESSGLIWSNYLKTFKNPKTFSEITIGRSAGADMFFLVLDKTPRLNPFLYGESLGKIFTAFIPRIFWPEKPWSFGVDFSKAYLDTPMLVSRAPSAIGELYANFHIFGVLIGFFLIGIFLKVVYTYCISHNTLRKENVMLYAIIVEKLIVLVDGPIADFFVFVLIKLFPFVTLGILSIILNTVVKKDIKQIEV